MKYHCNKDLAEQNYTNKETSLCGLDVKPHRFIYSLGGFVMHYAKEYECKKCKSILFNRHRISIRHDLKTGHYSQQRCG